MFAYIPCSLYLFSRIGPQYLTFKIGKNKTLKNKKNAIKTKSNKSERPTYTIDDMTI